MQIDIRNFDDPKVRLEAVVKHDNAEIIWSQASYTRKIIDKTIFSLMFNDINAFYKTVDAQTSDEIFKTFQKIKLVLDSLHFRGNMMTELNQLCIRLLDLHNFNDVKNWIVFKSNLSIPNVFESIFVENIDRKTTRERTYLRDEYVDLMTLSIIFKVMVPVWGALMERSKQDVDNIHKESVVFNLVNNSKLVSEPSFQKLKDYVRNNVKLENPNSIILNGISTDDYPDYMLALTVVRKLAVTPLVFEDSKSHLLTAIFKFIKQRNKPIEDSSMPIGEKKTGEYDSEIEGKLSALERYKLKQTISVGDVAALEHSISNIFEVANRLHYGIDLNFVQECIDGSKGLFYERLLDPQMTILGWVIKPIISPRGIQYLPKEKVVQLLGLVQAILWVRGHKVLSLFSTAMVDFENDVIKFSDLEAKDRLPKEMIEQLDKFYLHRRASNKASELKPVNQAILAIDRLTDDLSNFHWRSTAAQWMINETYGENYYSRSLTLPRNFKVLAAHCVMQIASRKFI